MKIILADDHQLFRDSLSILLELNPNYQVIAEIDNTDTLIESVIKHQPDLILQDYRMPGRDAISTLNEIKSLFPTIKIILLTGVQSTCLFKQLLKSKVDGVLLKDVSAEYLLQGIKEVINGTRVLCPMVQDCLSIETPELTTREFQVMEFIVKGGNTIAIAEKLNLTTKTIENHRYNLMQKLEVHNIVELIQYANDNYLLDS